MGTGVAPAKTAWLFGGSRARTGEKSVIVLDPSANSRIGRYHHGVRPPIAGWQFGWAGSAARLPSQDGKT
jgi:hypothetical protein